MPEQLTLVAKYYAYSEFKIPHDIKQEDIKEHYVKWGTLYLTLKDGKTVEIESRCEIEETLDTKRPREDWFEMIDYSSDEEEDQEEEEQDTRPSLEDILTKHMIKNKLEQLEKLKIQGRMKPEPPVYNFPILKLAT